MRKLSDDELSEGSGSDSDSSSNSSICSFPVYIPQGQQQGNFKMAAKAVLTCRPNSHPFQERTLVLDQPTKIGRSVARARPCAVNAIFDCKVLSRNHALLWHENGKFFLQDTKSSNGTFVNNQRLSKSSEESAPREVCSGDIVQFGVDVMEVNKKLTHGCIVANLQLFLPDGKEAKASSSTILPEKASNTPLQDVYLLNQYMKEAMQKEQLIDHKLAAITKLMMATKESMGSSWKSLIEEDRLLTRIDILERQMETSHKTMTDEKLREEITQLYEDKEKYQTVAKEALRKSMQDKMDILKKQQDLEKNVQNFLKEKTLFQELSEQRAEELQELAEKYEKSEIKSKELEDEIATLTAKYKEEIEDLNKKNKEGEDLLEAKQTVMNALISKMDVKIARSILAANNDTTSVILPENDSNKLIEEEGLIDGIPVDSNNLVSDNSTNNKNEDVEDMKDMKVQIASAEREKKEIQSRLMQMLILFEDLKAVSNKIQTSEYLSELIAKVDTEIHQIKNFINGDESLKNSYNLTEKMNEINAENHVNRLNSDSTNGIEKLLEESRETIKTLQHENGVANRQYERLQESYNSCAMDLDRHKEKMGKLSEISSDLKSQLVSLQDKLSIAEHTGEEYNSQVKNQCEIIEAKDRLIATLEDNIRALKYTNDKNSSNLSIRLNDLKRVKMEEKDSKVACQINTCESGDSDTSAFKKIDSSFSSGLNTDDVTERLLATEEELAVYKHRFSECSAECAKLSRECLDLKSLQGSISEQTKMVPLRYVIPIIVLMLAILIVFHPSS